MSLETPNTPAPEAAPAPTATPAPTPTPAPAAATSTDWTQGFPDDLRGYVQTKGFKAPQDVLESYRNLEKLHGVPQERILKLPENMDSPEARAVFERLGAPKDAKEYKIEIPKEHGDQALAEWFRDVAYKSGFTHKQVENLIGGWNERISKGLAGAKEAHEAKLREADTNLKKEWGAAYEQNKVIADQGAAKIGMGEAEVRALGQALGPDKAMMLLHKLGKATGEATFVTGQPAGGEMMDPGMAMSKIRELQKDTTFQKRYISGDADARRQWDRLNQMAAGIRP